MHGEERGDWMGRHVTEELWRIIVHSAREGQQVSKADTAREEQQRSWAR